VTGVTPVTCTVTSAANNVEWRDNTKAWTANQYKGWDIVWTSGANIGKTASLYFNDATGTINIGGQLGVTPSPGDTWIITKLGVADGVHPSSTGHIWIAQSVQEKMTSGIP